MPGVTTPQGAMRRRVIPAAPLPASLIEAVPLTLTCVICDTVRAARPDGSVAWHQVVDRDGALRDCPGVGIIGKD